MYVQCYNMAKKVIQKIACKSNILKQKQRVMLSLDNIPRHCNSLNRSFLLLHHFHSIYLSISTLPLSEPILCCSDNGAKIVAVQLCPVLRSTVFFVEYNKFTGKFDDITVQCLLIILWRHCTDVSGFTCVYSARIKVSRETNM